MHRSDTGQRYQTDTGPKCGISGWSGCIIQFIVTSTLTKPCNNRCADAHPYIGDRTIFINNSVMLYLSTYCIHILQSLEID